VTLLAFIAVVQVAVIQVKTVNFSHWIRPRAASGNISDSLLQQMATSLRKIRRNTLKCFVNCVRKRLTTKVVPRI